MDVSHLNPEALGNFQTLIIPTVMIPLTAVMVGLSMLASFIAGLFGIRLKSEGPRRLLEVLLKPKVLLSALVLNIAVLGGIQAYTYIKNRPTMLWRIESAASEKGKPSERKYENYHTVPGEHSIGAVPEGENRQQEFKALWSQKLPKGSFRSPVFSGGSVFIGSFDGQVYELDAASGEILRSFFVGTPVTPELMIDDGVLYVGEGVHDTHSARIYGFDLRTGLLKGAYSTKGHTEGQPVMAEHRGEKLMFVVAGADGVHAVNPTTFKAKWKANDGHIDSSVRVMNGRVFAGTGREKGDTEKNRSYAVAYDFSSGEKIWKMELPASSWMNPVVWREHVCFVYGEIYFESGLGGVQCFRQDTGLPTLTFNLASPQTTLPLVIGDTLYTTDVKGTVCALDLVEREVRWCKKVEQSKGVNFASPVYFKERDALVYASMSDGIYLLDRATGNVLFKAGLKDHKIIYAPITISGRDFVVVDGKGTASLFR
jgi:outer membrane protein assembly factor BamB